MAKSNKNKSKTKNTGIRKFFKIIGITLLVLFLLSILIPILYRWVNPPITPLMVIRKISNGATIEKEWKELEDISPYMVNCAVAAEDNNFLGHNGFDWKAIQRAIDENKQGKRERGASTISQQTAKNVFLTTHHSWIRKGMETYFTFLIETFWSKERIMEVYLNVIEMGDGVYGAEAAAQHYFDKSADKLTRHEAALITACYPAPLKRDPSKPTSYLKKRAARITSISNKIGPVKFDDKTIERAENRYKKNGIAWYSLDVFE